MCPDRLESAYHQPIRNGSCPDHQPLRLLLIEDDQTDAFLVREYLASNGDVRVELAHVQQLSTGLAHLKDGRLDAALVDLNLPDSLGVDTVAQVHACNPRIPIVVLTGSDDKQTALDAVRAGADDYLCKRDLEPTLLVRTIRYAIERAAHRQAEAAFLADQARSKEVLRKSEERYRRLLGAITSYTYSVTFTDGTWSTRHTQGCLAVTGYSPEEYAADPYLWIRMVHPEDRDKVTQYVDKLRAGGQVPSIEHRILRKNGRTCWIRNTILPRHDAAWHLVGWEGVVEDISERKQAEEVTRQREAHLWAAQAIQARLWPKTPPSLPGFDIAGASSAAEFAAGDFFDYLTMPDESIGLVVGDVAGHGLGPALVMALTYAHLRSLVTAHTDIRDVLKSVNRFLIKETDHFVSLFFGRLLPGTRSFVAVNAGHPPGYVVNRSGHVKAQLESTTFPLAIAPDAEFPYCEPVALETGDIIVLTTDGIREAYSLEGPAFGDGRLLDVVRANRDRSAAEIVDAAQRAVQEFCRPGKPSDDITAIVVKVGPGVQSPDSG